MSIRTKISVILLCAVMCFCAAEYCVQRFIILPGFFFLERDEAVKDSDRVSKAIENEIKHLNTLGWDWSAWDDTYDFVQSRSKDYIESNLVLSTFTGNHLNLIFICDTSGRVIWGRIYDLAEEKEIALDMFPKDRLPIPHPLIIGNDNETQSESEITGVLITESGPVAVSATPILKSSEEGPSRGTFIMGRFLNSEVVSQISEQTQVDFSITPVSGPAVQPELKISGTSPYEIEIVNDDLLKVHSILLDTNGHPAIAITTNFDRKISRKGYETIQNSIFSILAAGMGILVLVLLSLKHTILNRIGILSRHVFSIRQTGDLSKRLTLSGKDEIASLANAFDNMVSSIEKAAAENDDVNKRLRMDIEKRREAENALQESEKRFRTMVEHAGDAVFLHDSDGNFRIINQVACERLGYEKNMLLSLSMYDVDPDSVMRGDSSRLWKTMKMNEPVVFETSYQTRDGSFIPVEVSMTSIQYSGERLILSIARDVADRKQMDDQMRQAQKMEAMTTLTAGIAHNFNNILAVIVGCTELAVARLPEDNQAVRLLRKVEEASARAKDIVWQLIRFSQKYEESSLPVRVYSVIENEIRRVETVVSGKIKIISQLQADCYPILGDTGQFKVLMNNLLTNSVEAIKNGRGVIEVQLENISDPDAASIRRANLNSGKFIRIVIRDNGQGIDPAHMDRIFDPYFTTKDFSNGAGMGLSVVHGIVTNCNGSITVDSKVGRGTEINVFFPATEIEGDESSSHQAVT